MAYLNNIQLRILSEFLDAPTRPENTMTLHELRGFLWGLVSAPSDIDEETWIPFIFEGDDPQFADEQEEENITTLILGLWDEQLTRMEDDDSPLANKEYAWHASAEQRWPLTAWCTGLLKAHYWQEEQWDALLAETEAVETEDGIFDIAEEIDNTLEIAAIFADLDAAMDDTEEQTKLLAALPDMAEQLPWIMMNYAECGGLLAEMLEAENQEPYRREQAKIGRNDPCFCGSGKKYKNCCIHAANDE